MSNHLGDTNKMVSDTPRTDAAWKTTPSVYDFIVEMKRMERELNAANQIAKKYEDRYFAANDRIKRLEEAGDELRECASRIGTVASGEGSVIRRSQEAIQAWDKEMKP